MWEITAEYLILIGIDTTGYCLFCSSASKLLPTINRGDGTTFDDIMLIENECIALSKILTTYFYNKNGWRSTKLHWLLSHVVSQGRLFGLIGAVSDQSIERKHQDEKVYDTLVSSCKTADEKFRLQMDYIIATEHPKFLKA